MYFSIKNGKTWFPSVDLYYLVNGATWSLRNNISDMNHYYNNDLKSLLILKL